MDDPRETSDETAYLEGYRDTELGILPEEWAIVRLNDVLSTSNVRVRDVADSEGSELSVLSLTKNDGLIPQSERFNKRVAKENVDDYKLVRRGQVVYNPYVIWEGAVHVLRKYEHGLVSPVYPVWNVLRDKADPYFVDALLRMPFMIASYSQFSAGAVNRRRAISKKDFLSIQIPFPPLEEQRAIASTLRAVQNSIETTEQIIESTRELKRSLMNHLFTYGPVSIDEAREVLLKDNETIPIPEHWDNINLGALIAEGPQNGIYKPQSLYGEGTPIVRIDDYGNEGGIVNFASNTVQLASQEVDKYRLAPFDILVNRVNSLSHLGKTTLVGYFSTPAVFESNMMRFNINEDLASSEYVARFLSSPIAREQMRGKAKRAIAQSSINQGDVKSVVLPLPPLADQNEIISIFTSVDNKIAAEENRRQSLEILFKTLLHNLMTGKARLKDVDLSEVEEMM